MVISVLAVLSLSLGGDMVFWESHAGNEKANRFYADTIGAEHIACFPAMCEGLPNFPSWTRTAPGSEASTLQAVPLAYFEP